MENTIMKSIRVYGVGYGSSGCSISFPGYVISSPCCYKEVIPFGYFWLPVMQRVTRPLIHVLKSSEEIKLDLLIKKLD